MIGSILIVCHNNLHLTKKAVNSALSQDTPVDVLVLSNSCTDDTNRWLMCKVGIQVIYRVTQISVGACWNLGMKTFWGKGKSEVLVCNNDIELRPDTYRLLRNLKMPFVTGISVDTLEQLGRAGDRDLSSANPRPHPDYSCFMIRRSVTDKGLWFDEGYYPAYCEDSDHHVRMHQAGVQAVSVDLPFLHVRSQTLKGASQEEKNFIQKAADANRERFREKYGCYPYDEQYADLFKPLERPDPIRKEWEPDIPPEV